MPSEQRILITAGNTRELIDPVRYLSNVSTGVMGYELAKACRKAGHPTTLISGPTLLARPKGVRFIGITTSVQLEKTVQREFPRCDVLFMTSAVCDFRPAKFSAMKIRRRPTFNLKLIKTPDILKGLAKHKGNRIVVGFCLETENLLAQAKRKLRGKKTDFIVANFLGRGNRPFGSNPTTVYVLSKEGKTVCLKKAPKSKVAAFLLKTVLNPAR